MTVEEVDSDLDITTIPAANRTYWFKCEHCDNLHVVLEDEDGEKFATMVLDVGMIESMAEAIHLPRAYFKYRGRQ